MAINSLVMLQVYVIVYSHDKNSIANPIFFNSEKEAIDWKKDKIANDECGNPITAYDVKRLESL